MTSIIKCWASETPTLENVFGQDSIAIKKEFDMFIDSLYERGECCIDAYRIADAHSKEAMELYDTFVTCCGSEDIGKEVNGVLYMFGANYGH